MFWPAEILKNPVGHKGNQNNILDLLLASVIFFLSTLFGIELRWKYPAGWYSAAVLLIIPEAKINLRLFEILGENAASYNPARRYGHLMRH